MEKTTTQDQQDQEETRTKMEDWEERCPNCGHPLPSSDSIIEDDGTGRMGCDFCLGGN